MTMNTDRNNTLGINLSNPDLPSRSIAEAYDALVHEVGVDKALALLAQNPDYLPAWAIAALVLVESHQPLTRETLLKEAEVWVDRCVTVHALWCGFETSRGSNGKRTVIGRRAKPWLQISRMIDAELIPSCWAVPTMVKIMGRKRSP